MIWQIGPLTIHAYGLVLSIAMLLGLWLAGKVGMRHELKRGEIEGVWWWTLLGGLVGARLYHVVHYWHYYSQDFLRMLFVWDGGLAIYGALLGGMVVLKLLTKKKFLNFLDLAAVVLPLTQAVGRVGNFLNQELYGLPAPSPWGWFIAENKRLPGYGQHEHFLPLWLFESILTILLFGGLAYLEHKGRLAWGKGLYFALYLIGYGLTRMLLEPWRIEPWKIGSVLVGQLIGVTFILIGTIWIAKKKI